MSDIPHDWKALRGNAYPVREELKALGARWDRDTRLWWIAPENYESALDILETARCSPRFRKL